jgi:hypothetical protein
MDRLCGLLVRVLGYRSGGPGSIPGTTRKQSSGSETGSTRPHEYNWGATWKKSSGSCLENREYGRRDPSMTTWHPLSAKVVNHFSDKWRSLGRYSSLTDSDHGVFFYCNMFDWQRMVQYFSCGKQISIFIFTRIIKSIFCKFQLQDGCLCLCFLSRNSCFCKDQ